MSSSVNRIVFAIPEWLPHAGGLATFYRGLLSAFCSVDLPVTILTCQKDCQAPVDGSYEVVNLQNEINASMNKLLHTLPHGWNMLAYSLALGEQFRQWLRENPVPGTVVFAAEFLGYACSLIDRELPPIVVTAHGSMGQINHHTPGTTPRADSAFIAALESESLLRAAVATAYSRSNAQDWAERLHRDIDYTPPCFNMGDIEASQATPADGLDCVVVGRLQAWKGPLVLAEALTELDDPSVRVQWIGADTDSAPDGGSMASYLEQKFPDVWQKTFLWRGQQSRDTTASIQHTADLAIVPSNWDTFNFTLVEALWQGTPVVASTGAGAHDLIGEDNGYRFPVGNASALAHCLRQYRDLTSEERNSMRAHASQSVRSALDPQKLAQHYVRFADKAIERNQIQTAYANSSSALPLVELLRKFEPAPADNKMGRLAKKLSKQIRQNLK